MNLRKAPPFLLLLLLWVSFPLRVDASKKDTLTRRLDEIEIKTSRLGNFATGTTIDRLDRGVIATNNSLFITDIVSSFTGIPVTSYGFGGPASLSLRGGRDSHTAVLWNGLNIQNPMNGIANLSVVPAFTIKDISFQQGGSAALFGSGAVAGVVHISSDGYMDEQNNVTFQAGYGSFDRQDLIFTAKTGDSVYAFTLKIFKQSAKNDFTFSNIARNEAPTEIQTNAGMRNYGFMPGLHLRTSQNSLLHISALYQKHSKDMQTMMTESIPNQDNRADDNLYITANWKFTAEKYSLSVKSGLFRNRIIFTDKTLPEPEEEPISKDVTNSAVFEAESNIFISQGSILNAGFNFTNEKGESLSFAEDVSRSRFSFFSSYKMIELAEGLNSVFSLRSEFENGEMLPLAFSLGGDYQLKSNIRLKGNLSRNYRIPAFEELYLKSNGYMQGNPDLNSESGYTFEAGLNEVITAGNFNMELSQTVFSTRIKDWIVWLPGEENIWSPQNEEKGKSSGFEFRSKGWLEVKNSRFDFNGFYSYTNAKNTSNGDWDKNQMSYIPKHRFMVSVDYNYKNFSANFNFNHVGLRFYDQSKTIEGYQLGNLVFHYGLPVGTSYFRLSFRVNNLWDTEYQAMAWYAMPQRNYHLALNIKINTKY